MWFTTLNRSYMEIVNEKFKNNIMRNIKLFIVLLMILLISTSLFFMLFTEKVFLGIIIGLLISFTVLALAYAFIMIMVLKEYISERYVYKNGIKVKAQIIKYELDLSYYIINRKRIYYHIYLYYEYNNKKYNSKVIIDERIRNILEFNNITKIPVYLIKNRFDRPILDCSILNRI